MSGHRCRWRGGAGLGFGVAGGEEGWDGVDDLDGLYVSVGDAFDHGDDVVAGFFEPIVGVVYDAVGCVGFSVVAVNDPFLGIRLNGISS